MKSASIEEKAFADAVIIGNKFVKISSAIFGRENLPLSNRYRKRLENA